MECHHRAFACRDPALRVIYLDLVYQWRQIAEEYEAIDKSDRGGLFRTSVPGRAELSNYRNVTPTIGSLRHTTRHGRRE
jgi:hypothetical protein